VFDLSASHKLTTPSVPILVSVLSENDNTTSLLPPRKSEVRDEFNSSASDIFITASLPISFSVLSENEMKQHICYH
jgi:hypothetical protein